MKKMNNHSVIAKPWVKPRAKYTEDCRAAINGIAARNDRIAFTLIEMMVVIGIVAMLAVFGMPAVRTLVNSFHADGNTRMMINSSLACARAIAAKEQTYAGIRFQYAYNPKDGDDILAMPQYMIFIINDAVKTGLQPGFCAIEGMEPIKLPEAVGVMDLRVRTNWSTETVTNDEPIAAHDDRINEPRELRDTTTFSIVFSPSGKLIVHDVRTRNRDGVNKPTTITDSADDVFNSPVNIAGGTGMFVQDSWPDMGLGQELSRGSFIIYDANILKKTDKNERWSKYLKDLPTVHINPYTGTIINK